MNKLTLTLTIVAAWAALPAFAQYGDEECWNPRAGRFEQVRPGERQNDLDFSRCRATGFIRGPYRETPRECWNPRARHFEAVRPGERQDDLDFSRCHPIAEQGSGRGYDEPRECWNPRARHFEAVRPGVQQDDLDFSRCYAIGEREWRGSGRECWNPRAGRFEGVARVNGRTISTSRAVAGAEFEAADK
jgi:hypothetical protein